jgi:hypothetical protein
MPVEKNVKPRAVKLKNFKLRDFKPRAVKPRAVKPRAVKLRNVKLRNVKGHKKTTGSFSFKGGVQMSGPLALTFIDYVRLWSYII